MTSFIPIVEWRRLSPGSAPADRPLEDRAAPGPDRRPKGSRPRQDEQEASLPPPPVSRLSSREVGLLLERIRAGDPEARHTLILANSRLVAKIAHRYASYGSPLADLMQAGHCGLIRAAELYDPANQRAPFSSYAALWIMKTIQRTVADNHSLVHMPHRLFWLRGRYRKVVAELRAAANGETREVNLAAVASRMKLSPKRLSSLVTAMIHQQPFSDRDEDGKTSSLEESIPDTHRPDLDLEEAEEAELLHAALDRLAPFEAWLIRRRYGLDDPAGWGPAQRSGPVRRPSCEEIGRSVGIGALRIREIERVALQKLRTSLMRDLDLDEAGY